MKRLFALMVICFALLIEYPAVAAKSIDLLAESVTSDLIKGQLIIPPSHSQIDRNLNEAYVIQKAVTTELKTKGYLVAGFKTALTSGTAQMRYRNKKPVYGLLFNRGKLLSGSEIDSIIVLKSFHEMTVTIPSRSRPYLTAFRGCTPESALKSAQCARP